MPDTIAIISSDVITAEAFSNFFVGVGGELEFRKSDQGRLSGNGGHIWVFLSPDDLEELIVEGGENIEGKLGAVPRSAVIIEIGHDAGAKELALKFVRTFAEQWPSVINDLHGNILSLEELQTGIPSLSCYPA